MTSQIFANVYLNVFDRFVRHQLKPQAYVRYGDDYVLFASTRRQAWEFRCQAELFLGSNLGLVLNPKNDVVVAANDGLKFLGHEISDSNIVVDRHTTKSVLAKVSAKNIASYRSLYLTAKARQSLGWTLLEYMLT